jgi:hypothetical protein
MKRYCIVVFVLSMLTLASASYGQNATQSENKQAASNNAALQEELTAVEKGLWDAWKHNNVAAFHAVLRDDIVAVGSSGVSEKAEVLHRLNNKGCSLTDYSLEDFKLLMLDKSTALLTFKGAYTCEGQNKRSGFFSAIFTNADGKSHYSSDTFTSGNAKLPSGSDAFIGSRGNLISGKWMNAACTESSN